jgi:hypothetical protein
LLEGAITDFVDAHTIMLAEPAQFARFDSDFLAADVVTALGSTTSGFRPADLKAMLARETGDYTNIYIEGLEGKSAGVITSPKDTKPGVKECTSCIGLAQMQPAAHKSALRRAKDLGITAPVESTTDDPRRDPAQAIELAALYVAYIDDYISTRLAEPKPTGAERRKFVLAAYNGGPGALVSAVTAHQKDRDAAPYTWDEVAADATAMAKFAKPDEVRKYVTQITARAP